MRKMGEGSVGRREEGEGKVGGGRSRAGRRIKIDKQGEGAMRSTNESDVGQNCVLCATCPFRVSLATLVSNPSCGKGSAPAKSVSQCTK